MDLICDDKTPHIRLGEYIHHSGNTVLHIEPFIGALHFHLDLALSPEISFIAYQLQDPKNPCVTPYYGSHLAEVPASTFLLLIKDKASYISLLCLSHQDISSCLEGSSEGLRLQLNSGSSPAANKVRSSLLLAHGTSPHLLLKKAFQKALKLTGEQGKLFSEKAPLPEWLSDLGWTSRELKHVGISHHRILECVDSLKEKGHQLRYVLIEGGWETFEIPALGPLLNFEADHKRFPQGLKGLVDELKMRGVEYVGIGHEMMGSHQGIHSQLARRYNLPPDNQGRYFLGYNLGKTFEFFHDFYSYLRQQGIHFVAVRKQNNTHDYCRLGMDVSLLYRHLQAAVQAASSLHFNSVHLNTDCLRNENLFYWNNALLAQTAENIDLKNPIGLMRSIRNHLVNSLWVQHLMKPDFDIWSSSNPHVDSIACFHALSGSLNMIADLPHEHNSAIINKIAMPSGKIFSTDTPLTLCCESIFYDPNSSRKIYKAFTRHGKNGVVVAFNLQSGKYSLQGTISPSDVDNFEGSEFALYSLHHGFIGVIQYHESHNIKLKPYQADVFTFVPIEKGIAILGCYLLIHPTGPIKEVRLLEDAVVISSHIRCPLLVYSQQPVLEIRLNGDVVSCDYDRKRHTLTIDHRTCIQEKPCQYTIVFE